MLECAITGTPDPIRGQVVKATIVLAKGYEPSEELKKDVQTHVKRQTAPYKYPRGGVCGRASQNHQRKNPPGYHSRRRKEIITKREAGWRKEVLN